jgi:hypothetical protein
MLVDRMPPPGARATLALARWVSPRNPPWCDSRQRPSRMAGLVTSLFGHRLSYWLSARLPMDFTVKYRYVASPPLSKSSEGWTFSANMVRNGYATPHDHLLSVSHPPGAGTFGKASVSSTSTDRNSLVAVDYTFRLFVHYHRSTWTQRHHPCSFDFFAALHEHDVPHLSNIQACRCPSVALLPHTKLGMRHNWQDLRSSNVGALIVRAEIVWGILNAAGQ